MARYLVQRGTVLKYAGIPMELLSDVVVTTETDLARIVPYCCELPSSPPGPPAQRPERRSMEVHKSPPDPEPGWYAIDDINRPGCVDAKLVELFYTGSDTYWHYDGSPDAHLLTKEQWSHWHGNGRVRPVTLRNE